MKKKILVVDDDEEFLQEFREMLVSSGYDVTAVPDGVSAVKAVCVGKPDVIILDLRMRGMSGFEVADKLKGVPEAAGIPLIAMTGYYTLKEHAWLMNFCGITKCLKKPFNPLDVIAEIENVLKKPNNR